MSNKEMTPELLKEIKAYTFAQYWGQTILYYHQATPEIIPRIISEHTMDYHLNGDKCIIVKSLSSITDNEAKELAFLAQYHPTIEEYSKDEVWIGDGEVMPNGEYILDIGCRCWEGRLHIETDFHLWLENEDDSEYKEFVYNTLSVYQYLQQQGYALPIYFKGVHYSVEDLIKLGIYAKMD